jgi:hypothetical protein
LDTPDSRGINSKSSKVVVKYKENVIKYFRDHNVINRIRRLEQALLQQNLLSEEDQVRAKETLDAIDRDVTRLMLTAEAEVRKQNPYAFSLTLIKALQAPQFWQLWRKELTTGRDLCTQRSLIKASVEATLFEHQIKEGIRESYNALKEARAKSLELRDAFLRDRAATAANTNVE